ncbi:MAG: proteasome accessory factor PafA2 family protein, partial [candidate division NC10 bacterium]|nr:proteasome accessory factor PafA2 family protein [candidate division NC10 bacterium]
RLKRGKEFSAIEIQREYLDLALEYYQGRERSPQVADLLEKWQYVLDKLAEDPMTLNRELDWVIKHGLITSYINRKGCSFDDQRVFMLDLQYHDLRRDKGLYFTLERQGYVDRIVTDEEILIAMKTPPPDTRAYFRGMCLQKYPDEVYGASWSSVIFDTGEATVKRVPMADPLRGTQKLAAELLDRSDTAAELLDNIAV